MTDYKREAYVRTYAVTMQAWIEKYGRPLKDDREAVAELCKWAAAKAANDFSEFFGRS